MTEGLTVLLTTIKKYQKQISDDNKEELRRIFSWLSRYIAATFSEDVIDIKDKEIGEMRIPLEATFNIAIQLFKSIDKDLNGCDDDFAMELEKLKIKYLGQ